jgi:hypothetical protein
MADIRKSHHLKSNSKSTNNNNMSKYYFSLDENENPINAGNRITKDEFNRMLDDLEMVADYNTANFTLFVGKIVKRETPEGL